MIKLLTEKINGAILLSVFILTSFGLIMGDSSLQTLAKLTLILTEGILLNYLCLRFKILGKQTSLPLVLFCTLSVLIVPQLAIGNLIYGGVFIGALFLAFESREHLELSTNYMIYFGVLLGIAQTINNISIFLMLPVFVLFAQAGTRSAHHFILSIIYFAMVLLSYSGILFVMELEEKIIDLVPSLSLDYSVFNTILIKLTVPFILISLAVHFITLGTYRFRYPNKSNILNYTMLIQLGLSVLLIIVTADLDILTYAIMAASILLSFAFAYKQENTFVNASFASLICICILSLSLFKILIL